MPKFFIGQPVKKVRGTGNIGITGRVVGLKCYPKGTWVYDGWGLGKWPADFDIDLQVLCDREWINTPGYPQPRMRPCYTQEAFWEPIVPDGEKKIEWEESLFIPDGSGGLVYNRELIEEPAYVEVQNRSSGVGGNQRLRALRQVVRKDLPRPRRTGW